MYMLCATGSSARSGSGSGSGSGSAGSSSSANYTANEAEEEAEAEAFAEARFASIERAFAAAKAKGVQSSTRLVKELRALFMAGTFEVRAMLHCEYRVSALRQSRDTPRRVTALRRKH